MFNFKNKLSRMFQSAQTNQLETLSEAADAGNEAEVARILRHPKGNVYRLIEDAAFAALDRGNETGWKTLVDCTAELAKPLDADSKTYLFRQLFFGNAGYRGTPAMVDTVLTAVEKNGLGVEFDMDKQLAFFVGGSDKDPKFSAISDILIKHGANLDKLPAIYGDWITQTTQNWDKTIGEAQAEVDVLKQRKEAGLTNLNESAEAAKKFTAARKPASPTPGNTP